ncbi:MBL fold metallo-hydrolase [Ottowia sp.]|uniref:MBL fold metallo-hydrolase n=1 Tax=Ottowia sp. TaxID=1898956 RepID=UPI003A8A2B33
MRFLLTLALAACAALASCATSGDCEALYAASPQRQGCVFVNLPNPQAKPNASGWAIWSRFLFEAKVNAVPVDPIPVQPLTVAQLEALDANANHVVRLGHSSHLLKLGGRYWLIDPVFGERASPVGFAGPKRFHAPPIALQALPPIEGVIVSHDHYDHLDKPTIEYLAGAGRVQRFFVPLGVKARLVDMGVQADRVQEFDWWQSADHAGVVLTATPAQHFSGRTLTDRNRTLWAGWVLQTGEQKIYYSSDSGYFGGFKQIGERLGGFDLALIENGAYDAYWSAVHMTPEETAQAFADVRARVLYPVHNSTFDLAMHPWRDPLDRLAKLADQHQITLATPEIGEVLTVGQPRANRRWWVDLK